MRLDMLRPSVLLGSASGAAISISTTQIPEGQTGALAQLSSSLAAPQTFSRISGTGVTVNSAGAVTITGALTEGENRDIVVRVQNTSGDAIERRFTLTGFSLPVAPNITNAGTISGTRGDGQTISGTVPAGTGTPAPTVTYQWQADVSGSWADIVGATSQNYTDTTLTAPSALRRRVTFTNSSGSDTEFSNTLGGASGGEVADARLNALSTQDWLDTATSGATLATITQPMIGATYSITMEAQQGWLQPAAGTLEVVGNAVRCPNGLGAVNPGTYLVTITNNLTGTATHQMVNVLSNKVADFTAANLSQLNAHLTTISDQITGNPGAFPGRVIDLTPGVEFGELSISLPRLGQTRMVILRSSDANRVSGAMPVFRNIAISNMHGVGFQRLSGRPTEGEALNFRVFLNVTAENGVASNAWVCKCDFMGGEVLPNGASPTRTRTAPASVGSFHPMISYFQAEAVGSSITRIDLYVGHLNDIVQPGAAPGVWAQASTSPNYASFVGSNTPTGGPGIFTMIPTQGTPGSTFTAEFEVAYLDDTPRNTTHGGTGRVKPQGVGAPDGNYIVAWRFGGASGTETGGSWTNLNSRPDSRLTWANRVSHLNLPWLLDTGGSGSRWSNLVVSDNRFVSLSNGIRITMEQETDSAWIVGNYYDRIYNDFNQIFWTSAGAAPAERIWAHNRGVLFAFNRGFRVLSRTSFLGNPHQDWLQGAGRSGTPNDARMIPSYRMVGNTLWNAGSQQGAASQGFFLSDMFWRLPDNDPPIDRLLQPRGYAVWSLGNLLNGGQANQFSTAAPNQIESFYDLAFRNYGTGSFGFTGDDRFPTTIVRHRSLGGSIINNREIPKIPDTNVNDALPVDTNGLDSRFTAPAVTELPGDDIAELIARYSTTGDIATYGPFADTLRLVNPLQRCWTARPAPWYFMPKNRTNLTPNQVVVSEAIQLRRLAVAAPITDIGAGVQWRKGATLQAALDATPTSSPGVVNPGEWLVISTTAAATFDTNLLRTIRVDGILRTWSITTGANAAAQFPAGGLHANITGQSFEPPSAIAPWPVFTNVDVPAGAMIVFVAGIGAVGTPVIDTAVSGTGWQLAIQQAQSNTTRLNVWWQRNDTAGTVPMSLAFTTITGGGNRIPRGRYFIIPRTTPGAVLTLGVSPGTTGSSNAPNPLNLNLDTSRKAVWFMAATLTGATASVVDAPGDYDDATHVNLIAPAGTNPVGLFISRKFAEQSSEDAPAFASSLAGNWVAATFAVWEQ